MRFMLSAAVMLLASGCTTPFLLQLRPTLPDVKKADSPATLHLLDIEDARPKSSAPEQIGGWKKRPFLIERPVTEELGSLTQDLLEKAGYKVMRGSGPKPAAPRLVGKLEEFETALRDSVTGWDMKPMGCVIRLRLSLENDGKLLAQKTLSVNHQRRSHDVLGTGTIEKIVSESIEQLLDQAADFVESAEFRNAVASGR